MKYIIQDTDDGFELHMSRSRNQEDGMRGSAVIYRERGGHGPIEKLYAMTQGVQQLQQVERRGGSMSESSLTSLGLHATEFLALIKQKLQVVKDKKEEAVE